MTSNDLVRVGLGRSKRSSSIAESGVKTRAARNQAVRLGLLGCVCFALTACEKETVELPPKHYTLLATDIHVSVAQHNMVLPFIALGDYRGKQSFSLDRERDKAIEADALDKLMRKPTDSEAPKVFDRLSLEFGPYGWNDNDMQQKQICSMLTRQWTQSVCDNPWSLVLQSLPNRIELVDLSRLTLDPPEPRIPRCAKSSSPRQAIPTARGEAVMICELDIIGGKPATSYVALVRINDDLGAAWSVGRGSQSGETAEAMTARQGKAIVALVRYGLGPREDFPRLYDILCGLRAPKSRPGVRHLDCGDTGR